MAHMKISIFFIASRQRERERERERADLKSSAEPSKRKGLSRAFRGFIAKERGKGEGRGQNEKDFFLREARFRSSSLPVAALERAFARVCVYLARERRIECGEKVLWNCAGIALFFYARI